MRNVIPARLGEEVVDGAWLGDQLRRVFDEVRAIKNGYGKRGFGLVTQELMLRYGVRNIYFQN